ncbi:MULTISPECIES: DUF2783 domain-containing protein [unclassified Bosea (in: a-proteobacteria)]|uniref:DUF2783 domain-containing protein n=1 Tax=unclassified Bosea (in: a-proteobacteria) TaxID=2653178 RepID=UPI000F7637D8|nr:MULTISPECIES: DUF2783 domain-containing protein [unclassified Bosea (in: a-proteobacteria)]AZO78104.1 DNA topoisomerase IV [Bosea sp. Tri-49]RXT20415.1 DNA topoisomerase IV [Bosea sp. Tri-39]RXT37287.1 DNA topoisomerase IV [Bosea sp. Tri-54]
MNAAVATTPASELAREARFADPDSAFRLLAQAHRDLDERGSAALNARLVLILANHIGDARVLREAVALAHEAR